MSAGTLDYLSVLNSEKYLSEIVPLFSISRNSEMNRRIFSSLVAAIVLLQPVCSSSASSANETKAQLMVEWAVKHFEQHGPEATIAAINAGGSFKDGEIYVFMIAQDGVSVANAADQSKIGTDTSGLKDSDGKYYVREILDSATPEGAWVHYRRVNPATGKEQPKMSWVRKVDGYVIGCGIYMTE
jgi:cytochrome c